MIGTPVVAVAYTYSCAPPPLLGVEGADVLDLGGIFEYITETEQIREKCSALLPHVE